MIFKQPRLLAGAAPQCANFHNSEYGDDPGRFRPEDLRFPVHVILGEHDPFGKLHESSRIFSTPRQAFTTVAVLGALLGCLAWVNARNRRWVAILGCGTALAFGLLVVDRWRGIERQNDTAIRLLHDLGYADVRRTIVPGMGHDVRAQPVLDTFRSLWLPK